MSLRPTILAAVATAVAAASLLVPAAPAAGKTLHAKQISVFEGRDGSLAVDRERFAVYGPVGGQLVVRDMPAGSKRKLPIPADCGLADAAYGYALLGCGDDTRVLNLVTGHHRLVATWSGESDNGCCAYYQVGRRWLVGEGRGLGHPYTVYLNWRTGTVDGAGNGGLDPDTRGLDPYPTPYTWDYEPPFTLESGRTLLTPAELRLIRREGGRRSVLRLSACARLCSEIAIASRLATWVQNGRPHAYDVIRKERYAFEISGPFGEFGTRIGATRTHVVFSMVETVQGPSGEELRRRVFAARRPR